MALDLEAKRPGDIIKWEGKARINRAVVVIDGSQAVVCGTVLQASGARHIRCVVGGLASAICLTKATTGVGETAPAIALVGEAWVDKDALDYGSLNIPAKALADAALEALGVKMLVEPGHVDLGSGTGTGSGSGSGTGSGSGSAIPTGSGTGSGAAPTGSGTGTGALPTSSGSGSGAPPTGSGSGTGSVAPTGSGSGTGPMPTGSGSGSGIPPTGTGSGTGTGPMPTGSGTGTGIPPTGTGTGSAAPSGSGTGIMGYTVALLHMNGDDESVIFTDETGKTWTANGDAQLDTAQQKFGTASGLFDGDGDYVSTPDHDDWNFGTGNFTIDFWVRRNGTQSDGPMIWANNWQVFIRGDNLLQVATPGAGDLTAGEVADLTWTHIGIVRNGNTLSAYIDGILSGTRDVTGTTWDCAEEGLRMGYSYAYFNGHLDEMRISKGMARWTENFTPPVAEYELD